MGEGAKFLEWVPPDMAESAARHKARAELIWECADLCAADIRNVVRYARELREAHDTEPAPPLGPSESPYDSLPPNDPDVLGEADLVPDAAPTLPSVREP